MGKSYSKTEINTTEEKIFYERDPMSCVMLSTLSHKVRDGQWIFSSDVEISRKEVISGNGPYVYRARLYFENPFSVNDSLIGRINFHYLFPNKKGYMILEEFATVRMSHGFYTFLYCV